LAWLRWQALCSLLCPNSLPRQAPALAPGVFWCFFGYWAVWGFGYRVLRGLPALALAALAHLGLIGGLLILLLPALRTVAGRRQHAFGWALAALFLLAAGFYVDALRGQYPMRWLLAVLGLVMVLIIVAMSRISMRIVNRSIDEAGEGGAPYLARPPKRNLAILCIVLFTLAEFWHPGGRVSGWLACAAAAALCNLMGDWHVGRPLLRRWPFMLYAVYVCMALGYALIGTALLAGGPGASAGATCSPWGHWVCRSMWSSALQGVRTAATPRTSAPGWCKVPC
jgi:uncharacterized protein involved in response to NO